MKGTSGAGLIPERTGEDRTKTQGGARVPFSGRPIVRNTVCRSRDRGCKGHRIPRRVLVGGRHLGLLRATILHGKVESGQPWRLPHTGKRKRSQEPKLKVARRRTDIPCKRERRQRCQRYDRSAGAVGRQRPRSELTHRPRDGATSGEAIWQARVQHRSAEAFSGVVKHSVPR